MDRLDYVSMMCNEHAYVLAIEDIMKLDIPERSKYIRVMFDEITHIKSSTVVRCSCTRHRSYVCIFVRISRKRRLDGLL